jgi:hypothetical protein
MSLKRKHLDIAAVTAVTPLRSKRFKPTSAAPQTLKRKASDDTASDSPSPSQTKKVKLILHLPPRDTSTPRHTRSHANRNTEKATPDNPLNKRSLVPRGVRKSAKLGHKDETLLRLLCNDAESGAQKELHFRRIDHSDIDWHDMEHINKINNWRNQIYGRAGLKSKVVTTWLPDEELWFELYYQLSIAESRTRGMLVPKTVQVLHAFNATFVGQVLKDSHGRTMEPRIERQANAFGSKFNRMCAYLKARLHQSVFGKSGDVFVPHITMEMLQAYKQMKAQMAAKGLKTESTHAGNLAEWLHFFSHLPAVDPASVQNQPVTSVEDDAAAVLISMSTGLVNAHVDIKTEGDSPVDNTTTPWSTTPELSQHQSFSSSLRSNGPLTPSLWHSDEDFAAITSAEKLRSLTPSKELDIATMNVSPD